MNQLCENDLVYTQFGYGVLISLGDKKDFIEIEDEQQNEQIYEEANQIIDGKNLDENLEKINTNNEKNSQEVNNYEKNIEDNIQDQIEDNILENKEQEVQKKIDQHNINENFDNISQNDEFNKNIQNDVHNNFNQESSNNDESSKNINDESKKIINDESNKNINDESNKNIIDEELINKNVIYEKKIDDNCNIKIEDSNNINNNDNKNEQNSKPEDIIEDDEELPSICQEKDENIQEQDTIIQDREKDTIIQEKDKSLQEKENLIAIQKNQVPRRTLSRIKDHQGDKEPNIVSVKLHSGAIVHLSDTLVQKKIKISIKTFFGTRQVYYYNLSIQTTIQQLKAMVIESSKENQKIFYNMRLIYPMGGIKELSVMSQTLEMYSIPQNANLIFLVQTTFFWDPTMKGEGIKLSNSNLTANKHGESDYQSVLGNLQLSSGVTYWEIKIDFYVDEEDIFIGIARKSLDLYKSPVQTNEFWGYLCLCAKKFGPNGEFEDYGYVAKTNDIIGVLLEFKQGIGCLSFYKNGVRCGPAFNSLTGTFYPAVSMFYGEVQVTLDPKAPRPLN